MQDLIGAALAVSVGICISGAQPLSRWFEQRSYDLSFWFRRDIATEEVVIVSMDEKSRKTLTQPGEAGWDRRLHAKLLDQLVARGARAVVFTTVFSEPSTDPTADEAFAQALRRARGRAVLAAGPSSQTVRGPIPALAAAAPWGLLIAPSDADGVCRRLSSPTGMPTAAARAAQLLSRSTTSVAASRWMNYYSSKPASITLGYEQALRLEATDGTVKGRLVLVAAGANEVERFPTPYSKRADRRITRPELEAMAILNLWRGDGLVRMAPGVETMIILATGGFIGLFFMGRQRLRLFLAVAIAVVLTMATSHLLFTTVNLWISWLIVVGAQIPVACGWAWFCGTLERHPATPALQPAATAGASVSPQKELQPIHPATVSPRSPEEPAIPDHTLVKRIGRGAYGEVWLARNVIGRHQAVKIVKARSFAHRAPYEREFKGIERFASVSRSHPGLVQVLHIGRNDASGYFFYIMELADDASGAATWEPERYSPKTLASELQRRGHLPVRESVQIGLALCAALQHLHERQLVHRDIKPTNIIFVEGRVKVADIGLVAQITSDSREMTQLGTEGYLAPEGPGTPLADVYALGKVLYEISMGRDRWQFPEFPTTIGTRPDQAELRRLHEIILTACETDPALRFPSARAMQEALAGLLDR